MKSVLGFAALLFPALLLSPPLQATGSGKFMNTITAEGRCGHENAGHLQFLQNSDKVNAYRVMVKTTETHQGISTDSVAQHDIEAGGRKHLGCSLSNVAPLTSYSRIVIGEER